MAKEIKMRYPDGTIHRIKADSLVHYIRDGVEKFVLHYYDFDQKSSMITLLVKEDGVLCKKPLQSNLNYSALQMEEAFMIRNFKASHENVAMLPDYIDLVAEFRVKLDPELKPLTATQREIIIYEDRFGHHFWDEDGRELMSEEEHENLKNDPTIKITYRPVKRILVKKHIIIYYDGAGNYYRDSEGKEKISKEEVERYKNNPEYEVDFKKIVRLRTKEKIVFYYDDKGNYYADINGIRMVSRFLVEMYQKDPDYEVELRPIIKRIVKRKVEVFRDEHGNLYTDKLGISVLTREELNKLLNNPEIDVEYVDIYLARSVEPKPETKIVYRGSDGKFYHDREGKVMYNKTELVLLRITSASEIKYVDIVVGKEDVIASPKVTIYVDLRNNYYYDKEGLNRIPKEEVEKLSKDSVVFEPIHPTFNFGTSGEDLFGSFNPFGDDSNPSFGGRGRR